MTPPADRLYDLPYRADCARKVRRAVIVAAMNAWSFAVCAILSGVLFVASLPYDGISWVGLGVTLVLGVITYFEFRGRRLFKELNPAGAAVLGWNQLGLLLVIVAYCVWNIIRAHIYPPPDAIRQLSDLEILEQQFGRDFWPQLVTLIYGTIILLSVIYQGGNAWYYFSRRRHVEECIALADEETRLNPLPRSA